MHPRPLLLVTTATLAVTLSACSPTRPQRPVGETPTAGTPDLANTQALRERAAALLVTAASVPTTENTDPASNALRANAIEGLLPLPGRLEPVARAGMRDLSIGIRTVSAMAAGKARVRALNDDAATLLSDDSILVRSAAVYALLRNGGQVRPADASLLAQMLEGPNLRERAHAAFILGELGNTTAVPMLVQALNTPGARSDAAQDRLVRLQIAEAICKLTGTRGKEGERAVNEIRLALWPVRPEDLEPCALASQILGQLRDTESGPQLSSLTNPVYDGNNPLPIEVRLSAATALARMGSPRGVPIAQQALTDASPSVRALACATLGETRNPAHLSPLANLLNDPDPQPRTAAAAAIVKITDAR